MTLTQALSYLFWPVVTFGLLPFFFGLWLSIVSMVKMEQSRTKLIYGLWSVFLLLPPLTLIYVTLADGSSLSPGFGTAMLWMFIVNPFALGWVLGWPLGRIVKGSP